MEICEKGKIAYRAPLFWAILTFFAYLWIPAEAEAKTVADRATGISISVDKGDGSYKIVIKEPAWTFEGKIGKRLTDVKIEENSDGIGWYKSISFHWEGECRKSGAIHLYRGKPVIVFSVTNLEEVKKPGQSFPILTSFPTGLYKLSYRSVAFAVSTFSLQQNGSPWLFFDDKANAFIISPASNFMVARMEGDGERRIASGLNKELLNLPKGYTHRTLLVLGKGINQTWETWGKAMTELHGKKQPANDADMTLKYLGYWTDNGAAYYYNFEKDKGYEGTLLAVKEHYDKRRIPIRYMQLDSWFYPKSTANPAGIYKETGTKKPPEKPNPARWNNFGGMMEYAADKEVFSDGLGGFHKKLGLALITHNRWMDRKSPYHEKYKISGVGAIDPKWWDDVISRIATEGVKIYEQDWLSEIQINSPPFKETADAGEAFMGNMARACKANGVTMQYCMAFPRHFLQGCKYDNLTTIRVCWDRFSWNRWSTFLYTSRLASSLGIWPWVDVFRSRETNNILLSVLSAGIVGVSDAIGKEHKDNIMRCVRADGVIVKPDVPIVPVDACYINDAKGIESPVVAGTFTEHQAGKTFYVFVYSRRRGPIFVPEVGKIKVAFSSAELGAEGDVYVSDYFTGEGKVVKAGEVFEGYLYKDKEFAAYYIMAPVTSSGIAFLGDEAKFVCCGKKRIKKVVDGAKGLTIKIVLAQGENDVTVHGYAAGKPKATGRMCKISDLEYDAERKRFRVKVSQSKETQWAKSGDETTAEMILNLEL